MEDENRVREVLKEERSALQNTSTINWMRKRHNKTAINYYLNTPDEYKKHLTIEKIFNKFDDDHSSTSLLYIHYILYLISLVILFTISLSFSSFLIISL
jgi:hypothetical protein